MRYSMGRMGRFLTRLSGYLLQFTSGLKAVLVLLVLMVSTSAFTRTPTPSDQASLQDFPAVALSQLPNEGRHTYALIFQGGPFPYEKDGTVFGNRERLLPRHPRGYYREYTVTTPRLSHRGKRRIVCGGENPRQPKDCYYTQDHYASFARIVP
jgi:ribonuclease T1